MKIIEQIISEMKDDISRTKRLIDYSSTYFSTKDVARMATVEVLELYVLKLELLLNAEAGTNGQEGTKNDGNAV
ncbi:MAG: hypothetical protein QG594_2166 [Bacteroidota bacterium]|nr:hypothetical protein [Bacteroidota bacterium]